jgi:hypothetical protein
LALTLREELGLRVFELEKKKMCSACTAYGGRGKVHTGFWWGKLREREHLEESGVDGRIILR